MGGVGSAAGAALTAVGRCVPLPPAAHVGRFVEVCASQLACDDSAKRRWRFDLHATWSRMLQAGTPLLAGECSSVLLQWHGVWNERVGVGWQGLWKVGLENGFSALLCCRPEQCVARLGSCSAAGRPAPLRPAILDWHCPNGSEQLAPCALPLHCS